MVTGFLMAWFLAFFRFFLPRTLFEPNSVFKIGYPSEFALGVDTKFQQKYRIWVDRTPDRLFVIYARCTHLGCTPRYLATEVSLRRVQELIEHTHVGRRGIAFPTEGAISASR